MNPGLHHSIYQMLQNHFLHRQQHHKRGPEEHEQVFPVDAESGNEVREVHLYLI